MAERLPRDKLWNALFDLSIAVANRNTGSIRYVLARVADLAARDGKEPEAARLRQLCGKFADPAPQPLSSDALRVVEETRPLASVVLDPREAAVVARFLAERRGADTLRARGLRVPSRILLLGPAGCGKTTLAGALARELGLTLYRLASHAVVGKMMGDTANRLVQVFDQVARAPSCALLIDEADALFWRRTEGGAGEAEMRRAVGAVLPVLEALPDHVVVVAASNAPARLIDAAVVRRFHLRLDMRANVTETSIREIAGHAAAAAGIDLGPLPAEILGVLSECSSLAKVEEVVQGALRNLVLVGGPADLAIREAASRISS